MQVASYVAQATCHLQTCILANLLSVFAPLREIFIGIGARPRVVPAMNFAAFNGWDRGMGGWNWSQMTRIKQILCIFAKGCHFSVKDPC